MTLLTSRRGILTGFVGFLAAPAIVRAASLMPVKAVQNRFALTNRMSIELYSDEPIVERLSWEAANVAEEFNRMVDRTLSMHRDGFRDEEFVPRQHNALIRLMNNR